MSQKRRLIWLPEAVEDLERLRTSLQSKNPDAARQSALKILEASKVLKEHPGIGRPVEDPPNFRDLLIPFGSGFYVLRYRVTDEAVVVVRVWHYREHQG